MWHNTKFILIPGYGLVYPLEPEEPVKVAVDVDHLVPLVVRHQVHQAGMVLCKIQIEVTKSFYQNALQT